MQPAPSAPETSDFAARTPAALARVTAGRLAPVGAVVALANAGLLVLQLVAGRLLAPFVGSSLETWTAVIGAFLAGIALGNAAGGRMADRHPSGRRLALFLALGALTAAWVLVLPRLLDATGAHRAVPLGPRIPLLAAVLCFPPGFVLSLLTPLAIRLGLPDVRRAGRVAGLVFALGTVGCLAGNYVTGFYLIPTLTLDAIVGATAGLLLATALLAWVGLRETGRGGRQRGGVREEERGREGEKTNPELATGMNGVASSTMASSPPLPLSSSSPLLPLPRACLVVFLASAAGMTLELAAARLLAQVVGVSLYTWAGVIGVMLAGTAVGNALGGGLADRRAADPAAGRRRLAASLVLAAAALTAVLILFFAANSDPARADDSPVAFLYDGPLAGRVVVWTFALFFAPMLLLGTVSPQAIRLAVPDVGHAGRVAGRVYAWSTAGAIAGTFATGYVAISTVGVYRTVLLAALLPVGAAVVVGRVRESRVVLYVLSLVLGGVAVGVPVLTPDVTGITRETNYYAIRVSDYPWEPGVKRLTLDRLDHSWVRLDDPTYIHYPHEHIQMEVLRSVRAAHPAGQRVLVIGGGGYTFPRYARTQVPTARVEVVEIDPGVTAVAREHLGLDPAWGIETHHLDGRQFVAERAEPGRYHLATLDAVNDLTVPAHLLTREFNEAVRRTLTPDGVYLLTVIDILEYGRLWRSAVRTLRETFPHVEVLTADPDYRPYVREVYVIYASDRPLDVDGLRAEAARQGARVAYTRRLPAGEFDRLLGWDRGILLTDQFAPVDNLMAEVFRRREER